MDSCIDTTANEKFADDDNDKAVGFVMLSNDKEIWQL